MHYATLQFVLLVCFQPTNVDTPLYECTDTLLQYLY